MSDNAVGTRQVRVRARALPVARVLPLLGVPHLDRDFDYLVPESLAEDARPGCRVRVRFAGRLVDGFLLERAETTEHVGDLAWLERVISPEPVLTPSLLRLVDHVARRWIGVRSDVLRLAIPPRHAGAEKSVPPAAPPADPAEGPLLGPVELPGPWADHPMIARFVEAGLAGGSPRAVWTVPPGRDWARALAALPPLVKGYLRLGCRIGEGAVVDRQFGTTDVLIVLPVSLIDRRYISYYGADASRYAA